MTFDTIAEHQLWLSADYVRSAEVWRKKGDAQWARYLLTRHIKTRAKARALAKQEKKP